MSTSTALPRGLVEMALVLTEILRHEFKANAIDGGPTFTQFKLLHAIRRGVRHVGKLSDAFGISQPAASIMVEAMVKDGLVKRVPHPDDRRQIELHLTAKAAARIDAIYGRAFVRIGKRFTHLSAAKRKELAQQITDVTALMSEWRDDVP